MIHRRTFTASAAFALFAPARWAQAYSLPVIDVTNLSQNLITAIEQTSATILQGKQYIEDLKQTANTFPIVEQLSKSEEMAQLIKLVKAAEGLKGALRSAKATYDNLGGAFATSQYTSWKDFLATIEKRKGVGDKAATSLYDAAKLAEDQVSQAYDAHMMILDKMPIVEGVTQAAQATANSVGVLIQQQQAVLAMMSSSVRDQGNERQRQYDDRAKLEVGYKESEEKGLETKKNDLGILQGLGR
jgi:conjugal transfer/entry exclusion protein